MVIMRDTRDTFFEEWEYRHRKAEQVYNNLVSREFSREDPTNPSTVKAHLRQIPPVFIGLWGGSKDSKTGEADEADVKTLDFLTNMLYHSELKEVKVEERPFQISDSKYTIYIIFCDLHHIYANGVGPEQCEQYFNTLKPVVENTTERFKREYESKLRGEKKLIGCFHLNYSLIRLSSILDEERYNLVENYAPEDQIHVYAPIKSEEIFQDAEFLSRISKMSAKHSRWINSHKAEDIARFYVEFEIYFLSILKNYSTKRFGGLDFTKGIFFSYSYPKIQRPIAEAAQVPMLYLHSIGKGHHECPWYVNGANLTG